MIKKIVFAALFACLPICSLYANSAYDNCDVHYLNLSSEGTTSFVANVHQEDLLSGNKVSFEISTVESDVENMVFDIGTSNYIPGGRDCMQYDQLGVANPLKTYYACEPRQSTEDPAKFTYLFYKVNPGQHVTAKIKICRIPNRMEPNDKILR